MTREEAIEYLNTLYMALAVFPNQQISLGDVDKMKESVSMAISALSQEPSGDLISRQVVMDALCDGCELFKNGEQTCFSKCEEHHFLATLPSVKQEPKTGHWIPTYGNVKCSVCGSVKESRRVGKATHYCDFCGAKMVEPQEERNKECK